MNSYVSIDIETTGLNEDTCQVLSVGAVIDDWKTPIDELPTFHCYVDHVVFKGEPFALSMHSKIFRAIATGDTDVPILTPRRFTSVLHEAGSLSFPNWLQRYNLRVAKITVAGKNFGSFDRQFLRRLPGWDILMKHRFIDPGNLYYNPIIDDGPPSTETCMERAGILGEVAHTALEDALVVVKLIRHWAACRHMLPVQATPSYDTRADGSVRDPYDPSA